MLNKMNAQDKTEANLLWAAALPDYMDNQPKIPISKMVLEAVELTE